MNSQDVFAFLRKQLRAIKPVLPEELPQGAHYQYELHLDSLDLVELVARIEQRFGFIIVDGDLPEFVNLETTARYILARSAA